MVLVRLSYGGQLLPCFWLDNCSPKSVEQGNSVAMNSLGYCYNEGKGCDQNLTKAFEQYEKSAKLGYSAAMYRVGICYENGEGVKRNSNKALEWYTKAVAIRRDSSGPCARADWTHSVGTVPGPIGPLHVGPL